MTVLKTCLRTGDFPLRLLPALSLFPGHNPDQDARRKGVRSALGSWKGVRSALGKGSGLPLERGQVCPWLLGKGKRKTNPHR